MFVNQIEIPGFVLDIINELAIETGVLSIWLVGSRANENAKMTSDWDILVFSNEEPLRRKVRHECVDVLRVGPLKDGQLEGQTHTFPFDSWKWNQADEQVATYVGSKDIGHSNIVGNTFDSRYKFTKSNAICLWRK